MRLVVAPTVVSIALVAACDLSAHVDAEAPPIVIDVDAQRHALEDAMCRSSGSAMCAMLRVLDASDGEMADPPRFPHEIPRTLDIAGQEVDVVGWIDSMGDRFTLLPALAVLIDGKQVPLDREQIEETDLVAAVARFEDDTLTVDVPELQAVIVRDEEDEPVPVATIAAHAGGTGTTSGVTFHDGGEDALKDALADAHDGDDVGIALVADAFSSDLLHARGDDALLCPGGAANLVFAFELAVPPGVFLGL